MENGISQRTFVAPSLADLIEHYNRLSDFAVYLATSVDVESKSDDKIIMLAMLQNECRKVDVMIHESLEAFK